MSFVDSIANYAAAIKQIDVTVLRQQALAANIANSQTPDYKRIDIDKSFQAELEARISSSASVSHLQPKLSQDKSAKNFDSTGNNVQVGQELMYMQENSLKHEFSFRIVEDSLKKLRSAAKGST